MKHSSDREDGESAQTLITVAVLMVVLILFLALAVDVGHIYRERRQMQNAADAGALAGAREICFGDPLQAEYTAEDYAQRNGAEEVDVTIVDYWTVEVVAKQAAPTMFGGVIGMANVAVGADAAAICASANTACGLWPVALEDDRWDEVTSNGEACGRDFYVWSGDNINQPPDCDVYECDTDGDGVEEVFDMLQRAWLDFSDVVTDTEYTDTCAQPGCGAAELECWIRNDSGANIELPDCIAGDTGVKTGVKAAVDSRQGQDVAIPIFDYKDCTGVTCPGTSVHAIDWGCVTVDKWEKGLELPRLDGALPPWKGPAIHVSVACEKCRTRCGDTHGEPPSPSGLRAVSLIR